MTVAKFYLLLLDIFPYLQLISVCALNHSCGSNKSNNTVISFFLHSAVRPPWQCLCSRTSDWTRLERQPAGRRPVDSPTCSLCVWPCWYGAAAGGGEKHTFKHDHAVYWKEKRKHTETFKDTRFGCSCNFLVDLCNSKCVSYKLD